MNREEIKGEVGKEIVEDSCGCVFCDIDLAPELIGATWVHKTTSKNAPGDWYVPCSIRHPKQ